MTQAASNPKPWYFETVPMRGSHWPDPTTRSAAVPPYRTVANAFDNAPHGAGPLPTSRTR
ncbi:MAG: hypothetical protein ACSLE9_18815 [Burkholderiaceae bacterium]